MCPAVGQGALAIEAKPDGAGFRASAALDHAATRAAVTAERAVLAGLGGGCQVPIGAHARVADGRLHLAAVVAAPDGSELVSAAAEGAAADARAMGSELATVLLERGARHILNSVYAS